MKSKIFFVCIVLTGRVLAQEDTTTEQPEGTTKPELPPPQEGPPPAELMSALNGLEIKALDDAKNAETPNPSGEDEPVKKFSASLKSDNNNSSEETNPASSKEESADETPKKKTNIEDVTVCDTTPGDEATEKPKKEGPKYDDSDNTMKKGPKEDDSDKTTKEGPKDNDSDKTTKKGPKDDDSDKTTECTTDSGEEKDKKNVINAPEGKEVSPLTVKKSTLPPSQNPVQLLDKKLADNPSTGFKGADITKGGVIGYQSPKVLADHKMTPTEQQAYVCSLDKCDLCPMTVDLDEQVGIAEPGANAKCKELAATMGYSGFCVVLMKTDPETGDPIYTRTCAYYDPESTKRSTCSTNFLTTTTVTNVSQVKYNCSNGVSHYIPTSCVKKHRELVLP